MIKKWIPSFGVLEVTTQHNPKNTVSIAEQVKLQSEILLYNLHNYFVRHST